MKITKFFGMAALAGLVAMSSTSCSKDEAFKEDNQEKIVTLTVSQQALSRTVFEDNGESLSVLWKQGDKLSAFTYQQEIKPDLSQNFEFTLDKGEGTNTATFTGTVTGDPDVLYAYLVNKVKPTPHQAGLSYNPKHFCGSLDELSDYHFLCARFKKNIDGGYDCTGVEHAGSVFKFNISGLTPNGNISTITINPFKPQILVRAKNSTDSKLDVSAGTVSSISLNEGSVQVDGNGNATIYAVTPSVSSYVDKQTVTNTSGTITIKLEDNTTFEKTMNFQTTQSGKAYEVNLNFSGN